MTTEPDLVERYLLLGLRVGRHLDGFVDAYYGPPELARRVDDEPLVPLPALVDEARHLVADLEPGAGTELEPARRAWLRAQVVGVHTSARKLAGEDIPFVDEVEACYGVRPERVPDEQLAAAHARLEDVLPGSGPLAERYGSWREAQSIPPEQLEPAIRSFAEDLRERTDRAFGLPDGEQVEWGLVTDKPWSGFNHYLGDLRSRVEINTDLPVLSPSLAHLVSHEAYPGHHTEHSRKEVGLVRRRKHLEETIFLVGTPQCVLAEGLADLGLEVLVGERPEPFAAEHLKPLGIPYDPEVAAAVSVAGEALGAVRQNAALTMHQDGGSVDDAIDELERWALLPRKRAEQSVRFLTDPTWRAYISTYVEGLPRCRAFVGGDPARFERLLTEQLTPADLVPAGPGERHLMVDLSVWPNAQQPWADLLEVTQHADRSGWHGVYVWDHFMGDDGGFGAADVPTLEVTAALSALGALTEHLRVAPLVLGNTYRHPAVVANWITTLDHITGGRAVLGIGAGWQVNEHQQYGIGLPPPGERIERLDEAITVIRGLLGEPRTTLDGEHYEVTEALNEPKPVQERLPILVGGKGDRMLRLVARQADEWNMWSLPPAIAERMEVLDRACERIERDPAEIRRSTQAVVLVTDDRDEADAFVERMAPRATIAGPPARFAEVVAEWAELGVDEVIVPDMALGRGSQRLDHLDALQAAVADL